MDRREGTRPGGTRGRRRDDGRRRETRRQLAPTACRPRASWRSGSGSSTSRCMPPTRSTRSWGRRWPSWRWPSRPRWASATALRLDSRALAVLATLGGLLTPVILDTDTDAAAALFTYLAILDLGVLLLASRRGWPGLALLAFAGTQVLYWGWLDRWYQTARLPVVLGWATVFFLAFAAWGAPGLGERAVARRRPARSGADHPRGAGPLLRRRAAHPGRPVGASSGRPGARPRGGVPRGGARGGPERAWRPPGRPAPPRHRAGLPGAGARGDPRATRPGDRVERGGAGAPARRLRPERAGASRGRSRDQRARVGALVRGARRERRPGGDVPHRAPGAAGHRRRRGDGRPRRPRLPGPRARRGDPRRVGALRPPDPAPGRGRERWRSS